MLKDIGKLLEYIIDICDDSNIDKSNKLSQELAEFIQNIKVEEKDGYFVGYFPNYTV
jgi:hypothetical protein